MQHAVNTGNSKFNLLEQISRIDYLQSWEGHSSSFEVELSFTTLDWFIADLVNSAEPYSLSTVDEEEQTNIIFNIMHKGRTLLHKLGKGKQIDKSGKQDLGSGDHI